VCVDLALSSSARTPICMPACDADTPCRPGLTCRALPAIAVNGPTWAQACFSSFLGDIGTPCLDVTGANQPDACAGGLCLGDLGLEGYCSADCTSRACPPGAACAALGGAGGPAVCLATCGADACTDDPLLACEAPGDGTLGFTLVGASPPAGPYCAPRRCADSAECGGLPCTELGGASFCQPAG
jgi:hypothetical protein